MEALKERIDADAVRSLALYVPAPARDGFLRHALDGLDALELKARVIQVADALREALPEDWPSAIGYVLDQLPPAPTHTDALTAGMPLWPLLTLVERHGLDHPDLSLEALARLTPHWTAEYAVRPYFQADPEAMRTWVDRWSLSEDVHVRRLASEGSRPRLPWGIRLHCRIDDPQALLPCLERLLDDPSEYVRRSVANHLNDLAKDHPDLVLQIARDWSAPGRERLIRHGLRTLLKEGHPEALSAIGLRPFAGSVEVLPPSPTVVLGASLSLQVRLCSETTQRVRLDYAVHHRRQDGSLHPKVFTWSERTLKAGQTVELIREHPFVPRSVRRLHPGLQRVDVRVNGVVHGPFDVELLPQ